MGKLNQKKTTSARGGGGFSAAANLAAAAARLNNHALSAEIYLPENEMQQNANAKRKYSASISSNIGRVRTGAEYSVPSISGELSAKVDGAADACAKRMRGRTLALADFEKLETETTRARDLIPMTLQTADMERRRL